MVGRSPQPGVGVPTGCCASWVPAPNCRGPAGKEPGQEASWEFKKLYCILSQWAGPGAAVSAATGDGRVLSRGGCRRLRGAWSPAAFLSRPAASCGACDENNREIAGRAGAPSGAQGAGTGRRGKVSVTGKPRLGHHGASNNRNRCLLCTLLARLTVAKHAATRFKLEPRVSQRPRGRASAQAREAAARGGPWYGGRGATPARAHGVRCPSPEMPRPRASEAEGVLPGAPRRSQIM